MTDTVLSVALSLLTIGVMVLAGRKNRNAWLLGLANQGLWLVFIVRTHAWGLLLLMAALIWIYSQNYLRWRRDDQEEL